MVLVKVVQLIVNIDWWLDIRINLNVNNAWPTLIWCWVIHRQLFYRMRCQTRLVILMRHILYFIAHDVERDSQEEEKYTKDSKDNHG